MKLIHFVAGAATLFCMAAIACDDNNVGNSINEATNADLTLDVDTTSFRLTGESYADPQIQSRTKAQLLGKFSAAEYGELESDFVTEFMPAVDIDTTGISIDDIDSLKLILQVPMGSYVGDSITPMRVNVYRLNKNLPHPIYSDFDPQGYYSSSDLMGTNSYTMSMLGQSDTLYYYDYSNSSFISETVHYRMVDIKLPIELARDFYSKHETNPEIFHTPDAFAQYFPGIYVTSTYGNGRVIKITNTRLDMFCSKHGKTDEGNDTTTYVRYGYFAVSPEVVSNNNIRMRPAESIRNAVAQGEAIIQSPCGYSVKVNIPVRKMIEKYDSLSAVGLTVLNSLSIDIPAEQIENEHNIDMPQRLLLIKANEKDDFFLENKVADNITSYIATYSTITRSYLFSGLREYINDLLDKRNQPGFDGFTEKDEEFLLIPVEVQTEENNSYYNQETLVVQITPLIDVSMVRLDLDKAKISATYSKKNFVK